MYIYFFQIEKDFVFSNSVFSCDNYIPLKFVGFQFRALTGMKERGREERKGRGGRGEGGRESRSGRGGRKGVGGEREGREGRGRRAEGGEGRGRRGEGERDLSEGGNRRNTARRAEIKRENEKSSLLFVRLYSFLFHSIFFPCPLLFFSFLCPSPSHSR